MSDPNLNRNLGPYLLESVVGRGGMGTVYAARNQQSADIAAVKLLSPVLATDASFRERFIVEVESLKKLKHPNIVQLYGYGEQEGQLFYAMELIDGSSLQEELRRGRRFNWREVTRIAIEICAALKHAHDHGIIHRDLKPANLLYTPDETVKLLDFGIAKLFGNPGVTTGSVMGTADYMAPEQAEGKAVGPRTDLYSLGSVMYALLSGRPPFVGKSVPEVVHKVRFESPMPICRLANDVPIEMEQFIDQLLEKSPQKRIPTALAASHRLKAMEYALSVRLEENDLAPDDLDTSVAVTPSSNVTNLNQISREATVRMDSSVESNDDVEHISVTTSDAELSVAGPDHFTLVEDEKNKTSARSIPWQSWGSLLLLAALLVAGVQVVRVLLRPPSADQLYEQIAGAWEESGSVGLADTEREIDMFLNNYDADPRRQEVADWQAELQQYRLQRKLIAKARRRNGRGDSALEQLYLAYARKRSTSPDQAFDQLEALVQLYEGVELDDDQQQRYLELAQSELQHQQTAYAKEAKIHAPLIERRLADAASINDSKQARKIYQSILNLYRGKPWAAPYVAQAEEQMERLK